MKNLDFIINQSNKLCHYTGTINQFSYIKDSISHSIKNIFKSGTNILAYQAFKKEQEFFFLDDIVNFKIGIYECVITFEFLLSIKVEDFVLEIDDSKDGSIEYSIVLLERGESRIKFEDNFSTIEEAWTTELNHKLFKIFGGPIDKKNIYHVKFPLSELERIYDGSTLIVEGNSWDFHPNKEMPKSYKRVSFNERWSGSQYLLDKLSTGLKKKVKVITIKTDIDYDILSKHELPVKKMSRVKYLTVRDYLSKQKKKTESLAQNRV